MSLSLLALLLATPTPLGSTQIIRLEEGVQGPAEPLMMYFDKRLTFIMPDAVSLAVPGSTDMLSVHIKGEVVVVTLVDSLYVRRERPISNLTILTRDGLPFTTRIGVASRLEEARLDLIRVEAPQAKRRAEERALQLLERWLQPSAEALKPELRARLEALLNPSLQVQAERRILRWVAEGGLEALGEGGRRAKQHFIYLERGPTLRLGSYWLSLIYISNHSQPSFRVNSVKLLSAETPLKFQRELSDPLIKDDGEPRRLVLLRKNPPPPGALRLEVCENQARCVSLELSQ